MTVTCVNLSCRCCAEESNKLFTASLLNRYQVDYFECPTCGYVQTEDPYWLDDAYADAINDSDTGILARNQINARVVLGVMALLGNVNGTVVDCAGGYGILVRLLRDYGINAFWSDQFCQNLLAKGFEFSGGSANLVTVFEAFEHFVDPDIELDRFLDIAPNVLFSTEIIATPTPDQHEWWYYGVEHGQHIGFFRTKTLERLARVRGKRLITNGKNYHLITDQPVNQTLWYLLVKLNFLIPFFLKKKLKSKVWSDHFLMLKPRK
ncbi:class I SAM-dependent methyltransferase [Polynucleobacter sp. MG-5-Ahmo-C2]|uniref:class I SAM-dependent methyltransferase n=1 Tax=Polynucleobacter sp. MG-5-Ahmo-C2 TaxID=2081051 RepID=UPI001BFEE75A|nr:class I SAM-dependent methyltransferase [Polynucleobacter sp. MG-5-Ahmo-C2]QWD98814.1 class I SAM-dependent methyltransferase [Polynucleobacter sp. MG-5-Ahmo-C2]